jgi:malate synthase
MTAPFMRAYTELLVKTCHRRGAHAMGGMAAFVPSRKTPEINEAAFAKVRADKEREAADGFDGTWVAHPDTVSTAMDEFERVLGERPNQIERRRDEVEVAARDLLAVKETPGDATDEGLRNDVSVGIQYLSQWLLGTGASAIFNLMEDAATSEIARSQVWQWIRHGVRLEDGREVTAELVRATIDEELEKIREAVGDEVFAKNRPEEARALFEQVALGDDFVEFLTLPAYEYLD